jgi:hypothetical protein
VHERPRFLLLALGALQAVSDSRASLCLRPTLSLNQKSSK